MKHFVYILHSASKDVFYKGYSYDPLIRLETHNVGGSRYTSDGIPWKLVLQKEFESKKLALIEEKRIKRLNRVSILKLINT
ncbi:MAG: GIY-YIG nuclease family protein [Bacteroidia bacterium]